MQSGGSTCGFTWFEIGSYCAAQNGLKLQLLFSTPWLLDYRYELPFPAENKTSFLVVGFGLECESVCVSTCVFPCMCIHLYVEAQSWCQSLPLSIFTLLLTLRFRLNLEFANPNWAFCSRQVLSPLSRLPGPGVCVLLTLSRVIQIGFEFTVWPRIGSSSRSSNLHHAQLKT